MRGADSDTTDGESATGRERPTEQVKKKVMFKLCFNLSNDNLS